MWWRRGRVRPLHIDMSRNSTSAHLQVHNQFTDPGRHFQTFSQKDDELRMSVQEQSAHHPGQSMDLCWGFLGGLSSNGGMNGGRPLGECVSEGDMGQIPVEPMAGWIAPLTIGLQGEYRPVLLDPTVAGMPQSERDCWTETKHPANPGCTGRWFLTMASWPDSIRCHPHLMGSTPCVRRGCPACLCPSSDQEQLQLTVQQTEWAPRQQTQTTMLSRQAKARRPSNAHAEYHVYGAGGRAYHRSAVHSRAVTFPLHIHTCIGLVSSRHIVALVVSPVTSSASVVLAPKSGKKFLSPAKVPMCLPQPKRGCLHPAIPPPSLGYHPCLERDRSGCGLGRSVAEGSRSSRREPRSGLRRNTSSFSRTVRTPQLALCRTRHRSWVKSSLGHRKGNEWRYSFPQSVNADSVLMTAPFRAT